MSPYPQSFALLFRAGIIKRLITMTRPSGTPVAWVGSTLPRSSFGTAAGILGFPLLSSPILPSGEVSEDEDEPVDDFNDSLVPPWSSVHAWNNMKVRPTPPPEGRLMHGQRFVPPTPASIPQSLFSHQARHYRFRRLSGHREILIYTDGACINNGFPNAKAGYAFIFRPGIPGEVDAGEVDGWVSGRLEEKGPTGVRHEQTSNRAELRAVIGALAFREWQGEGWKRVVIATDSSYVVSGITEHIQTWLARDWLTAPGTPVTNRDLWEALLERLRDLHHFYTDVLFWRIPCSWNTEADLLAKNAAAKADKSNYSPVSGVLC